MTEPAGKSTILGPDAYPLEKVAYCHAGEEGRVRGLLAVTDPDARVEAHPYMRPGEAVLTCPPKIPFTYAHRSLMDDVIDHPEWKLADIVRMLDKLNAEYHRG